MFSSPFCYDVNNPDSDFASNWFRGLVVLLYGVLLYHALGYLYGQHNDAHDVRSKKGSHWIHVRQTLSHLAKHR